MPLAGAFVGEAVGDVEPPLPADCGCMTLGNGRNRGGMNDGEFGPTGSVGLGSTDCVGSGEGGAVGECVGTVVCVGCWLGNVVGAWVGRTGDLGCVGCSVGNVVGSIGSVVLTCVTASFGFAVGGSGTPL